MEVDFIQLCKKPFESENYKNIWMNLIDELSVSQSQMDISVDNTLYRVFYACGFRMCVSPCHSCLITIINDHLFVINITNRIDMHFIPFQCNDNGCEGCNRFDGAITYNYSNHFAQGTPLLVYLVLFIMELRKEDLDFTWWLINPVKPFTTHLVFSPNANHEDTRYSSIASIEACYKMYQEYLEGEFDIPFPKEMRELKPWMLYNKEQANFYEQRRQQVEQETNELRKEIKNISIPNLINNLEDMTGHYVYESYILFQEALIQNRQDIAVWLWTTFSLNKRILMDLVRGHKYNKVVKFVYSLF